MRILVLNLAIDFPPPLPNPPPKNWGGELRCYRSAVGYVLLAPPIHIANLYFLRKP
jgi:hypothetical protein